MASRECEVHFKEAGAFIVTWDPDAARPGWRLFRGPIRTLEANPTPERLGRAVWEAVDRPAPPPGFQGDSLGAALRSVGIRGETGLVRSSRSFHVEDDSERVTIRAIPAELEDDSLFNDLPAATCARDPEAVGLCLLDLRPRCPLSSPPTPPRPGRSYRPREESTIDPEGVTLPTFGYKCRWWVIDTTDAAAVVTALGLKGVQPATWDVDLYGVDGVFVSPSVLGWTFVLGLRIDADHPDFFPLLERLSAQFGEAQYLGTYRVVGYHAWAKAVDGRVVRAYASLETGTIDLGERTPEERELGIDRFIDLKTDGEDGDIPKWCGEDSVMRIAGKWSLNPQELDAYDGEGPGFVGQMP